MKRLLFQVHRWVGIALAAFMLLWFSSGLIIALSGSVTQSRGQQLAYAETLSPQAGWLSLGEAWAHSAEARQRIATVGHESLPNQNERKTENADGGAPAMLSGRFGASIVDARLVRSAEEPYWLVEDDLGRRFAISAVDGELREFSVEQARRIGERWLKNATPGSYLTPRVAYLDTLDSTGSLRNYQALKPFHRFAVNDGNGTELIISARSGEVVQAASRLERALYLAGDWLHLFRPLEDLGAGKFRRTALTWMGFAAASASLTGLIIGWLRWRPGWLGRPTYSRGRTQPYRAFWHRWHFWSGLLGGAFATLWAFSGFLSTNPWQMFSPATATNEELARYMGGEEPPAAMNWRPEPLFSTADSMDVVELSWRRLGDQAVLLAYTRDGRRRPQIVAGAEDKFDDVALLGAAQRLAGDRQIASLTLQGNYDNYYYPNHRQSSLERPLPIVRVELADAGQTDLYIDPQDGRLLLKQDSSLRAYRWLYVALHHWDFGWLSYQPAWTLWMVTWIAFGLVLSISSVVIGWCRMRRAFGADSKSLRKAKPSQALASAAATES